MAQRQSTHLAFKRPWIPSPTPKANKTDRIQAPVIPILWKPRQEDHKFTNNLNYAENLKNISTCVRCKKINL